MSKIQGKKITKRDLQETRKPYLSFHITMTLTIRDQFRGASRD